MFNTVYKALNAIYGAVQSLLGNNPIVFELDEINMQHLYMKHTGLDEENFNDMAYLYSFFYDENTYASNGYRPPLEIHAETPGYNRTRFILPERGECDHHIINPALEGQAHYFHSLVN
eukprot:308527_1